MLGQSSSAGAVVNLDVWWIQLSFPPGNHQAVRHTGVSRSHASSRLAAVAADASFGRGLVIPIKPLRVLVHFLSLTLEVPLVPGSDEAVER